MQTTTPPTDWQGKEIKKGVRAVYVNGSSYGNSWATGVVEDVVEQEPKYGGSYRTWMILFRRDNGDGPISRLSNISKIMVLD